MPITSQIRAPYKRQVFGGLPIGTPGTIGTPLTRTTTGQAYIVQLTLVYIAFSIFTPRAVYITINRPGVFYPLFQYQYPVGFLGTGGIDIAVITPGVIYNPTAGVVSGFGPDGVNVQYNDTITVTDALATDASDLTTLFAFAQPWP